MSTKLYLKNLQVLDIKESSNVFAIAQFTPRNGNENGEVSLNDFRACVPPQWQFAGNRKTVEFANKTAGNDRNSGGEKVERIYCLGDEVLQLQLVIDVAAERGGVPRYILSDALPKPEEYVLLVLQAAGGV